jgi:EmrB/QacA subfamily drug resistance transporter
MDTQHTTQSSLPDGADAAGGGVRLAFMALVLAMLPAVLDQTILATGLPTIARDLGTLSDVSWVVAAYVVAATASTPMWGKLGDRLGHKTMLQLSLVGFLGASALCGLAQDITQLVVTRAVQGVFAGGLMTLAMAAVGDLVSMRERGRYQGYIAATFSGATVLGPLVGGVLVEHASWRWVFYVNLPVGVAALAALSAKLPAKEPGGERKPLDVLGAALLAGATGALLLVCVWGGERYAWDSAQIIGLGAAALVLAGLLVLRERRAVDPIVPFDVLARPAVAVASAGLFLATACIFAVTVFVPVFLQASRGLGAIEAGLLLVPMMVGITLSTTIAGRSIARTGRYKRFPVAGLALMSAGLALLAVVTGGRSIVATDAALVVFGLGFGMVSQFLVVAVQNAVDRAQLGIATATTGFFRALGGAVGAAMLGAVFTARTAAGANVGDAVQTVFLVAAPLAAIALVIVARLPEVPLQERAASGGSRPPQPAASS